MTGRLRVLISYWYGRRYPVGELQGLFEGADVILDSGAFSAHTLGVAITVEEYADWLRSWSGRAVAAFSLDVIGDPVASLDNYRRLADADTGLTILPVFHAGTAARHLDTLLDEGVTYLGFGGLVEHSRARTAVTRWAAWHLRRCAQAGAVVHVLGSTGCVVRDLPFYSCDSSSWMKGGRGYACAWNPRKRLVEQVMFRSPVRVSAAWGVLRASGYDLGRLHGPRFLEPGSPDRAADREYLFTMSARAYFQMEQGLSAHRVIPAPLALSPNADPGTKVYLAATSREEFRYLIAAWAAHTERTSV
ncbi:hypothetical protein [Streptomyces sp. NPDC088739]|uniref:hypothetical protein n=1 Tax=Streptomyces sp. NPDC088739 TaxID=3365882 RepID=UPI0037F402C0